MDTLVSPKQLLYVAAEETPHFPCALAGSWSGSTATKGEALQCRFLGAGEQTDGVCRTDLDGVWMLNLDLCYVSQYS